MSQRPGRRPPRLRRLRRIWKWLWRGSVLLLVLLYLGRNAVVGPLVLRAVGDQIEAALGTEVEFDSMHGSWLWDIGLGVMRTRGSGDQTPLRRFEIRGVKASYSLWQLLRGRPDWLKSVHVQSLSLDLDLRQQGPDSEQSEEDGPLELPTYLPAIEVANLDLAVTDGQHRLRIPSATLRTLQGPGAAVRDPTQSWVSRLQLLAEAAELEHPDGSKILLDFDSKVDYYVALEGAARFRFIHDFQARTQAPSEAAHLHLEGGLDGSVLHLDVHLEQLDAALVEPWLRQGLAGRLALTGKVLIDLEQPLAASAELQFGSEDNRWQRYQLDAVNGDLHLEGGVLSSTALSARGPGLFLAAEDLRWELPSAGEEAVGEVRMQMVVDDVQDWLLRTGRDWGEYADLPRRLDWKGRVTASGGVAEAEVLSLLLDTGLGEVAVTGSARLSLDGERVFADGEQRLQVRARGVDLVEAWRKFLPQQPAPWRAGSAAVEFTLSGNAQDPECGMHIQLHRVQAVAGQVPLSAEEFQADFRLRYETGAAELEQGTLTADGLSLRTTATLPIRLDLESLAAGVLPVIEAEDVDLRVFLDHFDLDRLLLPAGRVEPGEVNAHGQLNAQFALSGSLAEPRIHLDLTGSDLRLVTGGAEALPAPLGIKLQADYGDGQLQLSSFEVGDGMVSVVGEGRMTQSLNLQQWLDGTMPPFNPEGVDLKLRMPPVDLATLPWLESATSAAGEVSARFQLGGSLHQPELELGIHGTGLRWRNANHVLLQDPASLELVARYANGTAVLERLRASAPQFELKGEAVWAGALDLGALASGQRFEPGVLEGLVRADAPDLRWLGGILGVRRLGGALHADLRVEGPLHSLNWEVDGSLKDGVLRLDNPNLAALDRLQIEGRWRGGALELPTISGELGAAPFQGSGSIDLLAAAGPAVDLRLVGQDLLLFRQPGLKLRSDAGLHVHGTWPQLRAEGDLELTDGRYVKAVDFFLPLLRQGQPPTTGIEGFSLFSLGPPLQDIQLDLAVHPGSGFRVRTNVADGLVRPDLKLRGNGEVPFLVGQVYLDQFFVNLPTHRIRVEHGVVRFEEDNPFVPRLDIQAGFRRYGYNVTILIEGSLLEPVVRLTSVPPLEPEELLLFATTGQPPQAQMSAEEALGTVAVYLAQDWVRRFLGDESTTSGETLADRIEIEFGRDASNRGAETIEGRFLIRRDNLRPDDALFLTGERDAYGDFNLGLRIRFLFP